MMDQLAGASIEMLLCELCHELCVLPYSFTAHVPGMLWVFSTDWHIAMNAEYQDYSVLLLDCYERKDWIVMTTSVAFISLCELLLQQLLLQHKMLNYLIRFTSPTDTTIARCRHCSIWSF
ncbi:hypothetical protein C5167_048364 [Papaver somniferum]|uniref:Uncharacterized protein n=1 Tax=Papaver somniferum TaxID=3469 RepID=A0A4Y7KLC4_PAPSO|nr:hypothetical protein C5167_048364 [Papaver somniferum]